MHTIKDRSHFLELLKELNLENDQIIEVLITLIDDWEIRAAVKNCQERRKYDHTPIIKLDLDSLEKVSKENKKKAG